MALMFLYIVLILVNIFAWHPVLNFWFSRGWEQGWLIGICGDSYNMICLMKGHGFLYLMNYLMFGWNATGWYLTAIALHIIVVFLIFALTNKLSHSRLFSFIVALFFSVNVAHNDVITWGSFESLYALVMICFLASIITFQKFREDKGFKRYAWYGATIVIHLFALFIREPGTLIPAFLLISDVYFLLESKKWNFKIKENLHAILTYSKGRFLFLIPFFILSIGYLQFRSWYGGAPNDIIDEMVRLKTALIEQGRYSEYLFRSALAFGKFEGAHVIPYPIMNLIREILLKFFTFEWIRLYFFSIAGILYIALQAIVIYWYRKAKVKSILIYSLLWNILATTFFSLALPLTEYGLLIEYGWDTSRWRYFALFGTLVFWTAVGFEIYKNKAKRYASKKIIVKTVTVLLIISYFLVQLILLRIIEDTMYKERYKPAKDFYTAFLKEFPKLPSNYFIYSYPFSSPLNDYIFEWYYIREVYYPNLTEERIKTFGEGIVSMFLERYSKGTANINTTYFLDYSSATGLQNRTNETKNVLVNQKEKAYTIQKLIQSSRFSDIGILSDDPIIIDLDPKIHVETPYFFEITLSATPREDGEAKQNLQMDSFVKNRLAFLENTAVDVCGTAPSGSLGSPAIYVLPENIIDGNFGRRSLWIANCIPAWITLDLGETKEIGGLALHAGKNSTNYPTDYTIEVSLDGKNWRVIDTISNNDTYQRIHLFSESVEARHVRLNIYQTAEGQMTTIDEVEVISSEDIQLADMYANDFTKLVMDSWNYSSGVLRFSWNTNPNNWQPNETIEYNSVYKLFPIDGNTQSIVIAPNENEFFSASGQFLKRMITNINLDFFGKPSLVEVEGLKVIPKYPVRD